jgi:hypothetical protein
VDRLGSGRAVLEEGLVLEIPDSDFRFRFQNFRYKFQASVFKSQKRITDIAKPNQLKCN